jgi:hypothetical protein
MKQDWGDDSGDEGGKLKQSWAQDLLAGAGERQNWIKSCPRFVFEVRTRPRMIVAKRWRRTLIGC